MNRERGGTAANLDPRMRATLEELKGMIRERYPTAAFAIARSPEEPDNVHLRTIVDLDDADEVLDLVAERLLELQVEEKVPVHVIPIRTPERVMAAMRLEPAVGRHRPRRSVPLVGGSSPVAR